MTTFTWAITALNCYPQADDKTDVVFTVHWTCYGTDGTYNGTTYSTCPVTYVAGTPFTPYDQLTQEQVLSWIWSSGVDKSSVEAAVQSQIDNQINPPVVSHKLPWTH
jgi:hypothetical protein